MRNAKPWFRAANKTWYICINGRQIKLGKNEKAAQTKFQELMRHGTPVDYTVRQVLQAYWKWAKKNLAPSTCENRKLILESFSKAIKPTLLADDLRALHVQKWIDANDKVNQLRHAAATEVRREFGLEAAQVILGHSQANVTQIYAERDLAKGLAVARALG